MLIRKLEQYPLFLFLLLFSVNPVFYTTSSMGVLDHLATDYFFFFTNQLLSQCLPSSSPSKLAYHYQVNIPNHPLCQYPLQKSFPVSQSLYPLKSNLKFVIQSHNKLVLLELIAYYESLMWRVF